MTSKFSRSEAQAQKGIKFSAQNLTRQKSWWSTETGSYCIKRANSGDCLSGPVVRLHAPTPGAMGSIPGWGTKILQASRVTKKKKKEKKRVGWNCVHPFQTLRSVILVSSLKSAMLGAFALWEPANTKNQGPSHQLVTIHPLTH